MNFFKQLFNRSKPTSVGTAQLAEIGPDSKCEDHPVHSAAETGDLVQLAALVEAQPSLVHRMNAHGETPLHLASDPAVAAFLLDRNADPNASTSDGYTPLHKAAYRGDTEVARALLERGAKGDAKNEYGSTPDKIAWQQGNYDIRSLLKERLPTNAGPKRAKQPQPGAASAWRKPGEPGVISVKCQKCGQVGDIRGRFSDSAYKKGLLVRCHKCGHNNEVGASVFSG